jgi:peptidoglycan/LPS O-acetylase OafA/YrhL
MSIPPSTIAPRSRPVATASLKASRPHLDYLDGLRGLAAIYVVLHHSYMEYAYRGDGAGLSSMGRLFTLWLNSGQGPVDVFIVLSGYCLMIPVARTPEGILRGGVQQFLIRRARRILPPYYVALILTLLPQLLFPALRLSPHWPRHWSDHIPNITSHVIISHLFLLHNLSPYWNWEIDYPMWSIATEWQIYFLFPLLLLPVWRRFGLVPMVILAFAVGTGIDIGWHRVDQAAPWLLGLFALGMAGAVVNFSNTPIVLRIREHTPWIVLFALSLVIFWHFTLHRPACDWNFNYVLDGLAGLATVFLLIYTTRHLTERQERATPLLVRVMQSRPAVEIGIFSYSLYLIHAPFVALVFHLIQPLHLTPGRMMLLLMGCALPLSLVFAYVFHRIFERPFMPGHPKSEKQAAQAAVISPAP